MSETISRLEKSKLEWQDLLSAEAYKVLFKEATEPQTVPASGFFLTEAAEPHIEIRLPC